MEVNLVITEEEESTLRAYFSMINPLLPAVDEVSFWKTLSQYRSNYSNGNSPEADSESNSPRLSFDVANSLNSSTAYAGFRVLLYTMLCAGAKVQGRQKQAREYYEHARRAIGPCFSLPSSHLISSLIIMTTVCRVMCASTKGNCGLTPVEIAKQAAIHAALAHKMCEMVPVSDTVRSTALIVAAANSEWDISPPISSSKHLPTPDRFACNFSWIVKQIMDNFSDIDINLEGLPKSMLRKVDFTKYSAVTKELSGGTSPDVEPPKFITKCDGGTCTTLLDTSTPCDQIAATLTNSTSTYTDGSSVAEKMSMERFFALLDDTLKLHKEQGYFSGFPLQAVDYGTKGLLLLRCNPEQLELGLDYARKCIHLASAESLARYSYPLVILVARLLPAIQRALGVLTTIKNVVPISLAEEACNFISSSAKVSASVIECPAKAAMRKTCPAQLNEQEMHSACLTKIDIQTISSPHVPVNKDPCIAVSAAAHPVLLGLPTHSDMVAGLRNRSSNPPLLTAEQLSTMNEYGIDEGSIAHAHAIATMQPKPNEKTREMKRLAKEVPQLTCPRALVRVSAALTPFGNPVVDNLSGTKRNRNTGTMDDSVTTESNIKSVASGIAPNGNGNKSRLVLVSSFKSTVTSAASSSAHNGVGSEASDVASSGQKSDNDPCPEIKPAILPGLLPEPSLSRMSTFDSVDAEAVHPYLDGSTTPMGSSFTPTTFPPFLDSSWISMTEEVFGDLGEYLEDNSDDAHTSPLSNSSNTSSTASVGSPRSNAFHAQAVPGSPGEGLLFAGSPDSHSLGARDVDSPLSTHRSMEPIITGPHNTLRPTFANVPVPLTSPTDYLQPPLPSTESTIFYSLDRAQEIRDDEASVTSLGLQLFPPGLRAAATALSHPLDTCVDRNDKLPQQTIRLPPSLEMGLNSGELEQLEKILGWDLTPIA